VYGLGLVVGVAVGLSGWSMAMMWQGASNLVITAGLTLALMPPIALLASAGRGYLPPIGWAFLTTFLAQIVAVIGWGAWFPWSVPALFSELAGPRATQLGVQSYVIVAMTLVAGLAATFAWWHSADQTR
jgi:ABC-2 type transport system permease protein